jgi:hypothetical protein
MKEQSVPWLSTLMEGGWPMLYAAILKQAIDDYHRPWRNDGNRLLRAEALEFLRSDWARQLAAACGIRRQAWEDAIEALK